MPPWSGNSDNHVWSNDLSLTDSEIETIVTWAKGGAPQGDPADLPEAPTFPKGWKLGEPDFVVTLDSIEVPAEGEDIFPQQIVEVDLGEPRWVRAIEFLPEDSRVTHHFLTTYVSELNEGDPRRLRRSRHLDGRHAALCLPGRRRPPLRLEDPHHRRSALPPDRRSDP